MYLDIVWRSFVAKEWGTPNPQASLLKNRAVEEIFGGGYNEAAVRCRAW